MNNKAILWGIIITIVFGITAESKAVPKQQPKMVIPKEQPKMGGTLVYGMGTDYVNPNPFTVISSVSRLIRATAYESLLTADSDGKIVPSLAETYEISAGGAAYTLHLRKDVKFHNGKGMTADDVIWSANHIKDPKNAAYGQNLISDVKSAEKIDDYTVKFILSEPSVAFLSKLTDIRMLLIAPANSLKPGQIKLENNIFIPGTGPFQFEEVQPGFKTVLKKFPGYWGGPAYLDKLIFQPIPDDASRFNALRAGDVQMAEKLSILDSDRVKKGGVTGIKILTDKLGSFRHFILNYGNPLLQKKEMRQAILYATDNQRLIDEVYYGGAIKADLLADPEGIWAKAARLPPHKRDLAKVKTLLKIAGYNGQELRLVGQKQETNLYESYQRMLGEAGIKVKIEIVESGVRIERIRLGQYDLAIGGSSPNSNPSLGMKLDYYTSKVDKGGYSNPKVDQLFDKFDKEFDEKKRLEIFRELAWLIHNDAADIPLFCLVNFLGMSENVRGFGSPKGDLYNSNGSGEYFKHTWLR